MILVLSCSCFCPTCCLYSDSYTPTMNLYSYHDISKILPESWLYYQFEENEIFIGFGFRMKIIHKVLQVFDHLSTCTVGLLWHFVWSEWGLDVVWWDHELPGHPGFVCLDSWLVTCHLRSGCHQIIDSFLEGYYSGSINQWLDPK